MTDQTIRDAISTKGVLASISISTWQGHRLDKKLSDAQQQAAQAQAKSAIRVHKTLISDKKVKEPSRIAGEARRLHSELTLPWHYDGVGLLPGEMVLDYDRQMGKLKHQFWEAVEDVRANYPLMVVAAAQELGSAFDSDDYPSLAQLATRYRWAIRFERLPTTGVEDLRLSVPEEAIEIIRDQISHEHEHLIEAVVERMSDTVGHVLDRLQARQDNDKAKIYTSTIEKLEGLPEMIRKLNVTGDERIDDIVRQLKAVSISTKEAKEDAEVRQATIETLATVRARISGYFPTPD